MRLLNAATVLAALVLIPAAARAQSADPTDAEKRALEERIAKELAGTGAGQAGAAPAPPQPQAATAGPPAAATGGSPYARLLLLPDISAIGSFAAAWNHWDVEALSPRTGPYAPRPDEPAFLFQELELGIQAAIDPYARADVFASMTPDGVDVEEAYLTTLSLPGGLQAKAGKFFSPFGRVNQMHPHTFDFVDAPLAIDRLLAPEKLSGPGAQIGWLSPLPWYAELTVAAQSTAVDSTGEQRITGLARLLQYFPLGEAATLGVGLSAASRAEGGGEHRDLGGADVYLRIRPPASRAFLAITGEVFARRLGTPASEAEWGGYAQAFWRWSPYLGAGVRWDTAPTAPGSDAPPGHEQRFGAVAAWFPSEFERLRLEVTDDRLPGGGGGVSALLGLEFVIGAHGAHPF